MHSFIQMQNGEEKQGKVRVGGAESKKIPEKGKRKSSQRNLQFSKELAGIT